MPEIKFAHCDNNNSDEFISTHDRISDKVYLEDGVLTFEFKEGFLVSPNHPSNDTNALAQTDLSILEFVLHRGESFDAFVYVFKRDIFKRVIRKTYTIEKLIEMVNKGECTIQFLAFYSDINSKIVKAILRFAKKDWCECELNIHSSKINYLWNNIVCL